MLALSGRLLTALGHRFSCAGAALVGFVGLAAAAEPPALNAYWTDTPPVLDGRMDDACWRAAEAVTGFKQLAGDALTQQTEVRFAYDGRSLYVFWTLIEADPGNVEFGDAETARDFINRREAAELFLDVGRTQTDFVALMASPRGARYDLSSKAWLAYNPDWECVAGRTAGGWTLEQRIPFAEFAEAGRPVVTPRPGEIWGIQLYRKKAKPVEVSGLVPGGDKPAQYGTLCFRGRQGGAALPAVTACQWGPLFYGPGTVEFTVSGVAGAVEAAVTVRRAGREIGRERAVAAGPDAHLRLPYRLVDAGACRLDLEVTAGTAILGSGAALAVLPPLAEPLAAMDRLVTRGTKVLAKDRHPVFPELRKRLAEFDRQSRLARAAVSRAKDLTAEEWRALLELHPALAEQSRTLAADINRAELLAAAKPAKAIPFVVGAVTSGDKVYPDTLYSGSLTAPVRLSLAGNEARSFQLVVVPFWTDLRDVTVSFSPLTGPEGAVIPADACRWFRVEYVKLGPPPAHVQLVYEHEREPDPLMPPAPFAVPAGEVRAVWVDVRLPAGTPAGRYTGEVTVSANDHSVARDVIVEAAGFDIPVRSSVEIDCWFSPSYNWHAYYLNAAKTLGLVYTPELHARHAAVLGRYRMGSFPGDWTFLCRQVPIFREADGHFTFDWTRFDQYVHNALANGSTAFWCALSCNSGWSNYLNSASVPFTDRAAGKRLTIGDVMQAKWTAAGENDTQERFYGKCQYENPVYRDFLVAYVAHLKELGILDRAYYELFDEANQDATPRRWLAMIEHHRFFRQLVPELRLLNFGVSPTTEKGGQNALGLIDVWAPHLFKLADPSLLTAIHERQAKNGEKFWFYTCTQTRDSAGRWTPYVLYHQPYVAARIHGWFAWHLQADGFLIYALNSVPKENLKPPDTRWPKSDWSDGGQMGCGTLVYPGPDEELIPGMRLANVRDGLQDYEYFAVLRGLRGKLDPRRQARLVRKIDRALTIDPEIITSVYVWTQDPARLDAKRAELAELIRKAEAVAGK